MSWGVSTKPLEEHRQDVLVIQEQIIRAYHQQMIVERQKSNHHLPHITRAKRKNDNTVSVAKLNKILGLEGNAIWAEPGVTMDQLCWWTLKHGLIPSVVPEFRGITVGGSIMGAALESSSFKHGQFSDICEAYEVLLGDGSHALITPEKDAELFYGISGSYGTLASLTAAKVRLQPVKEYVEVNYHFVHDLVDVPKVLEAVCQEALDYVDAVVLDRTTIVVMTGRQVSREQVPKNAAITKFGRFWHRWFIQHVLNKLSSSKNADYIPIEDYLFRYDRGAFWMGQYCTWQTLVRYLLSFRFDAPEMAEELHAIFKKNPPTLNPSLAFRMACGWKLSSRDLYRSLHRLPKTTLENAFHIQDFYIPLDNLGTFLTYVCNHAGIYPLWLCPLLAATTPQFLSPHFNSHYMLCNVGVYGVPQNGRRISELTRELEKLTHNLGGRKMLYGINEIPEDEFWQVYDRKRYEQLRGRSHASVTLTSLYEKVHV